MDFSPQELRDRLSKTRMMVNPSTLNNQQIATPRMSTMTTPAPATPTPASTPAPQPTGFDPSRQGTHQNYFDVNKDVRGMFTSNSGGEGGSDVFNEEGYNQYMKDHPGMEGVVSQGESFVGGEGGSSQKTLTTNLDKLPDNGRTSLKYPDGSPMTVDQVFQVKDPSQVKNPNQIVFDPRYGYITPPSNRKPTNQIGLAVAGATLGALGGFTGAGSLLGAARGGFQGLASGNFSPVGLATSLAGSYLGGQGVPSWMIQAGKAGLSLANTYNKGR